MNLVEQVKSKIEQHAIDALSQGNLEKWMESAACMNDVTFGMFSHYLEDWHADINLDDILSKIINHLKISQKYQLDTPAINELYGSLQQLEDKTGHIRVAIRRIRHGNESSYHWGVLAKAPESMGEFYVNVLSKISLSRIQFYIPQQQCSKHECDDIFKSNRPETLGANQRVTPAMYLRIVTSEEFQSMINNQPSVHFQDPVSGKTGDSKMLIAATIQGYYSNENYRISIPEIFFKK